MKSLSCFLIVLIAHYGCLGCTDVEEHILSEPPQGSLECTSTVKGSHWVRTGIKTLDCDYNSEKIICTVEGISDNDIIKLSLHDDSTMTCIKQCIFKFIFTMQGPLTSSIIVAPSPSISLYPSLTVVTVSSPSTTIGTNPTKLTSHSLSLQTSTATATPSLLCSTCSSTASPSISITVIASVATIAVVIILTLCISGTIMCIISIAKRRGTTRINEDNSDTQELVKQNSEFMIGAKRQDLFKEKKGGAGAKPPVGSAAESPVGGAATDSKKHSLASSKKTSSTSLLKNIMDVKTNSNGANTTKSTPAITKRGSESSGVQTMEESAVEPDTIRSAELLTQFEEEVHRANKPTDIKRINPLMNISTI